MKLKHSLFIFIAAVLVTLPIRVYQMLYVIDDATGFFKEGSMSVPILTVLLVMALAAILVSAFLSGDLFAGAILPRKRTVGGIAALAMGVMLLLSSLNGSVVQLGRGVVTVQQTVYFVFSIITAGAFLLMGVNFIMGKGYALNGVFALVPVIWACVRLTKQFLEFTTIANISENLYDILMLVFTVLFLFYHAKVLAGMSARKSLDRAVGFGLCAALFAILCTIPRFVLTLNNGGERLGATAQPTLLDLVLAVYIVIMVATLLVDTAFYTSQGQRMDFEPEEESLPGPSDSAGGDVQ